MARAIRFITEISSKYISKDDSVLQSIYYIQWLLKSLGILTSSSEETNKGGFFNIFIRMTSCTLQLWVIISVFIRMFDASSDFDTKILLVPPLIFTSSGLLKYCGLIYRQNIISQSLEFIKNEWKITTSEEFRHIIKNNMNTVQTLVYSISAVMLTVAIFYNLAMPIAKMKINNSRYNISERIEMVPGYDSFEKARITPYYEILYFSFVIMVYFCFTTCICSCSLGIILGGFIYTQIEMIVWQLNDIVDKLPEKKEITQKKISDVVRRHVNVIDFSKHMEEIFKEICLIESVAVTLVVCASEHGYLKMWERQEIVNLITYLVTIAGLSSSFLIFCWISEIIEEQMFRVSLMSYEIDWHKLPHISSQSLILIIAIAQRPQRLTAGGLINLSFVTFLNFLKTTYVYLKILQQ